MIGLCDDDVLFFLFFIYDVFAYLLPKRHVAKKEKCNINILILNFFKYFQYMGISASIDQV